MKKVSVFLLLLSLFTTALYGALYLNGVKIDGQLSGQTIKNCTIEFKKNGDMHIVAKNYEIAQKEKQSPATQTAKAAVQNKPYYIVFTVVSGSISVPVTFFLDGKQVTREVASTGQLSIDLGKVSAGKHQIDVIADANKTIGECSVAIGVGVEKANHTIEISVVTEKKGSFGPKGLKLEHLFTAE
ncbi:hypothetical protein KAH37_03670 [bacterium]|nr:hypothetical protein [bacterium]